MRKGKEDPTVEIACRTCGCSMTVDKSLADVAKAWSAKYGSLDPIENKELAECDRCIARRDERDPTQLVLVPHPDDEVPF